MTVTFLELGLTMTFGRHRSLKSDDASMFPVRISA
jgi:hypothetical protein